MVDPFRPFETSHAEANARRELLMLVVGLLCGLILAKLLALFWPYGASRHTRHFEQVRELVGRTFVDATEDEELVEAALQGMVRELDDYSRYYTGHEVARLDRETSGLYRGIGVVFRQPSDSAQVLFPLPGSPADRSGVRVGDTLTRVDDQLVEALQPGELSALLRREDATEFSMEVQGLDGIARRVRIRPELVVEPTVRHARMLDTEAGVGYVALLSFSRQTPEEFDSIVGELRERGLRSLVIDLRDNPGGVLDSAVAIANRFIREGLIVSTRSRARVRPYPAEPELATMTDLDLAVLINGGAASASEVLAGALQDHRVAVLVGMPTYGKGVVQSLTRFDGDGAVVKLTTSRYYTPAHRRIDALRDASERAGIAPDLAMEIGTEVLDELLRYRLGLSPPLSTLAAVDAWEARLGTPLYDRNPPDAVLDAAVELLLGRVPPGLAGPASLTRSTAHPAGTDDRRTDAEALDR